MKLITLHKSSALLILVLIFAASCSDPYELANPETPDPEIDFVEEVINDFYVRTYEPSIEGVVTTFSGEIVYELENTAAVEYGFMWYDPEDYNAEGYLNIQEIVVGSTDELIPFTTEVTGLPNEKDLVVCSFIRGENNDTYIGDEISF